MALLEKEAELGMHQTGHNSGVIHAGIYYKPGSLKAQLCVEGARLAYDYLEAKRIPYRKVGKLIVALNAQEVDQLAELHERAVANRCAGVQMIDSPEEIARLEPNCVGVKALWSPNTGIVDWAEVNRAYGEDFRQAGGTVLTRFEVTRFRVENDHQYPISITGKDGQQVRARFVITAAGLQSDKVARMTKGKKLPQIGKPPTGSMTVSLDDWLPTSSLPRRVSGAEEGEFQSGAHQHLPGA